MVPILEVAKKLLHKGRYFLFVVLAFVLLFVGFALRGFIPVGGGQPFQVDPTTIPTLMAQVTLPDATPTDQSRLAFGVTTTPVMPNPITTSKPGVGIVITMTPAASTGQKQATTPPIMPGIRTTQIPSTILQPTGALPLATSVPSFGPGQSLTISQIRADMQNLYRIMQATMVTMQTLMQGQPTDEEIAAMQAQVSVIALRMNSLLAQLQAALAGSGQEPTPSSPSNKNVIISPEQVRDLLILMQQAMKNMQIVLTDPSTDSATLAQAQTLLGQLQGMMGQVQILVAQMQTASQPGSAPAKATPAMKPSSTATPIPTVTRIPTTVSNGQLSQYQALMSQMEQILRQMQSILQQQQNQKGPSILPSATP